MLRQSWIMALLMAVVTVASALYVGRTIDHQWVPHDEGALAQSAERMAHGELPHRDFGELYTGGLTEVNALAFRVLGVRLAVLRVILMVAFVLWVPAVYYVASRYAGPLGAALPTVVAVTWSLPNYPAALPSWYNLFFAVFATAALLRFFETDRRRWLVACGVAAGLSVCIKIVGVYLIGALALALLWHDQTKSAVDEPASSVRGARTLSAVLTAGLCGVAVAVLALVRRRATVGVLVHFWLPTTALVGLLIWREWRHRRLPPAARLRGLGLLAMPFAIGCVVPIALLVAQYASSGAVHDLVRGVFITPTRRLQVASWPLPSLREGWPALALATLLAVAVALPRRWQWIAASLLGVFLTYELVKWVNHPRVYTLTWAAGRVAIPVAVAIGAVALIVRGQEAASDRRFAILAVAALSSLVQFPFSAPIYFCYVAPLAVLAVLAVLSTAPGGPGPVAAPIALFFATFAVLEMNGQTVQVLGRYRPVPTPRLAPLALARAGLSVPLEDAATYDSLIPAIQRHAGGSRYVYAAPDCPEVSFLAGLSNPTRMLFDIFGDSGQDTAIMRLLRQRDIHVVAINTDPEFSSPIDATLDSTFRVWYPDSATFGRFIVRWRP
jgi:Dolichyl-phosphate-mannose-protein mannosyltransferase